MTKIVNIRDIDSKLRKHYEEEERLSPEYRSRLERLEAAAANASLRPAIVESIRADCALLRDKLRAVRDFEFYSFDTGAIVAEFDDMMKTPVVNSFFAFGRDRAFEERKRELVEAFLARTRFYAPDGFELQPTTVADPTVKTCDGKYVVVDECTDTCAQCFGEKTRIVNNSSFFDNSRVNISSKYTYDRKIHFRDCINQYQGKQNTHIPPEVFKNIEAALVSHRVIAPERSVDRFARVTVAHVHMFLKSLNYTKYYDDAILIHSVLTGEKPDNIEHLEEDLMKDFEAMLAEYDKNFKTADRKNFINTQYVLYQLLMRHKHKCDKEHFVVMRTMSDRKSYHDRICKTIFNKFGWEFTP